jgi:hypothetical protein
MGFFTALLVSFVLMVVAELIRPKQNPQNAKASGLDDFDAPTAEEGRSIPVFAGKVKITGPNLTWYGDLEAQPVKKKVKTGLFSSKKQTINYKYYMGQELCMAHGRDDIYVHKIMFDDDEPKYSRTLDPATGITTITFADEEFYGGKESGGGITGTMRIYRGTVGQGSNAYLSAQFGEEAPPYEGLFRAVMEHVYLGTSNYIKTISWIVSSYPNQLGLTGGMEKIGDDANPACIIYEVLTNSVWGCGISPIELDVTALRAAGKTFYDEEFGISVIYNGGSNARDVISDILRHIDGVMFNDPDTGLYTIELARGGYDEGSLPVYDASVFVQGVQFSRPSWAGTKNHVKGTYVDPEKNYEPSVISQADLANVTQRGGEMAYESIDYTGFSTYAAASKAVARSLKTLSYPLGKLSGPINMTVPVRPRPNGLFRGVWDDGEIKFDTIFRITSVDYGTVETNTYQIEAVEDIFAISGIAAVQPDPNNWIDPLQRPSSVYAPTVLESPFYLSGDRNSNLLTLAGRRSGLDMGYHVHTGSSQNSLPQGPSVSEFTACAALQAPYVPTAQAVDSGFAVNWLADAQEVQSLTQGVAARNQGETLMLILSATTEEFVAFTNYNANTSTFTGVARGLLDTVPQLHPAGAAVFILASGYGLVPNNLVNTTAYAKLVPFNGKGAGELELAALLTLTTRSRAQSPLPPGNVKVNGQHPLNITGPISGSGITLSWAGRHSQDTAIVLQDAPGEKPNSGSGPFASVIEGTVLYRLLVRDSNGNIIAESSSLGVQNNSATINLNYTGSATFQLYAIRTVPQTQQLLVSYQPQVFTLQIGTAAGGSDVVADEDAYEIDGGGA